MEAMSMEVMQEKYPMVFNDKPHSRMSDRYSFVNTGTVVKNFMDLGMTVHSIQAPKQKKGAEFAKHIVRMNLAENQFRKVGDHVPQILILNSHNGSTSLTMQLGIFRIACLNGLIVAESDFAKFYQRHSHIDIDNLYETILRATKEFNQVFDKIGKYKETMLTVNQKKDFAQQALNLIYNEQSGKYELEQYITPQRTEDEEPNLYNLTNIIQENYMKGGITYETKKGHKKSKAVKSVDKDLNVNILLWALMNNFYEKLK